MREINLREYQRSFPVSLCVRERDALRRVIPSITIEPTEHEENAYSLTPGSTIGAADVEGLSVLIEPKIGIPQVLSLACYAIGKVKFQAEDFDFRDDHALPDVLAMALTFQARLAFASGLLHGYRNEEDTLYTVRGRIRFDDQLRRRFVFSLPVEVRYDEFTGDILANQLVKAAAYRLGSIRLRSLQAGRNLGWLASMLDEVSLVEIPSSSVPVVRFDRLNQHYRGVVELSRVILRHGAFEVRRGTEQATVRATGFLMDMNVVFQEFVTGVLRDALGVSPQAFGENSIGSLDREGHIHLRPDLAWWEGSRFVFVGDAKYKKIVHDRLPNADLYQLLAYATALDLPGGLLIYAKDEAEPHQYHVRHADKLLEVAAMDLSGTLDQTLTRVAGLAERVRELRRQSERPVSSSTSLADDTERGWLRRLGSRPGS